MEVANQALSLRRRRALIASIVIPCLFTVAFLVAYPPLKSDSPFHQVSLTPAMAVLSLGVLGWCFVVFCVVRAASGKQSGSVVLPFLFLFVFSFELLLAYFAVNHR
jgi:hypothetical protein